MLLLILLSTLLVVVMAVILIRSAHYDDTAWLRNYRVGGVPVRRWP